MKVRMTPDLRHLIIGLLVMAPPSAQATTEDLPAVSSISRAFELPAQRRLIDRISRPDAQLLPFTTDGCSGGLSTGWRLAAELLPGFAEAHATHPPWEACCVIHDAAYHNAGGATDPEDSMSARLGADLALRNCVAAGAQSQSTLFAHTLSETYDMTPEQIETAFDLIASAMFQAVRAGGGPCTGLPWRWGYGWPACHVLAD